MKPSASCCDQKKTDRHDALMMWLDTKEVLEPIINKQIDSHNHQCPYHNLEKKGFDLTKRTWEYPILVNKHLVGKIDLLVELSHDWVLGFEVKPEIRALGSTIGQINYYKEAIKDRKAYSTKSKWFIVTSELEKEKMAVFSRQGIGVILPPPTTKEFGWGGYGG